MVFYGIRFLAPQQVLSPTQSLLNFSGCHVNNIPLTISSRFHPTSSLVVSQSVTSLRPLNRQIAKSHPSVRQGLFLCHYMTNFELGDFSIGYVIATSEPADSQVSSFSLASTISLSSYDNFELDGFLIGYIIATSEPADSQVSSFSPARTTSSLVASQSVMSL